MARRAQHTLSVAEIADVTGFSPATIYAAIQSGDLPAIRLGRRYRVLRTIVDRLLADPFEQTAATQAQTAGAGDDDGPR